MAEDVSVLEDKIIELEEKINELSSSVEPDNDSDNAPIDELNALELQAKIDELEMEKAQLMYEKDRDDVANQFGLPDEYKEFLVGESRDELERKALELSKLLNKGGDEKEPNNQNQNEPNSQNQEWFNVPPNSFAPVPKARDIVFEMEKGHRAFDDVLDLTFDNL